MLRCVVAKLTCEAVSGYFQACVFRHAAVAGVIADDGELVPRPYCLKHGTARFISEINDAFLEVGTVLVEDEENFLQALTPKLAHTVAI